MKRVVGERGAALVTIMLFTALIFILITTMLSTLGNEVLVSGGHRDAVRAFEHAQAGLEEGIRRIEAGRNYGGGGGFQGSLATGIDVRVVDVVLGQGAAYLEVRSDARVGLARRRLSTVVLAAALNGIQYDVIFGYSLASQGSAAITSGDVYSETFVDYKTLPMDPDSITFSAWAIRKRAPDPIAWCYKEPCTGQPNWRPRTRRADYRNAQFRPVAIPGVNPEPDPRSGAADLTFACDAAGRPLTEPYRSQTVQNNGPGFQSGDRRADTNAVIPDDPPGPGMFLYGCDIEASTKGSISRPYTWVREAIDLNGDGVVDDIDGDAQPERLWMKTIVYEDWFNDYWCLNNDPAVLKYEKCNGLQSNPALGAVPPFPDFDALAGNYDEYQTGGGVINASTTLDFGCKYPEMGCAGEASRQTIVLLDDGDYKVNANLQGYGVLLVDGDLEVNGTLEYWGLMIVRGKLTLGSGNVIVHGGLIAEDTAEITGNITVEAGTGIAIKLLGPATVTRRTWWER